MLSGTPVVASNLPGVRMPVRMTGMGEIAPIGDSAGLADSVLRILRNPGQYRKPHSAIAATFDIEQTLAAYEQMFEETIARRKHRA
jgi:hypothetical protein